MPPALPTTHRPTIPATHTNNHNQQTNNHNQQPSPQHTPSQTNNHKVTTPITLEHESCPLLNQTVCWFVSSSARILSRLEDSVLGRRWWVGAEKLSKQGASPLPRAVTLYRVYTGAKTPAQGHRRLVGRRRQQAATHRCRAATAVSQAPRRKVPEPEDSLPQLVVWQAGRARPTPAADAGPPHSTSTSALLRTPCNDEDDNVQRRDGCTAHVYMNMFKTRRQADAIHSTLHKLQCIL